VDAIRFTTDDGVSLEGELRLANGSPRATAVLCHAHPRHGGSKDHPVLWAVRNDLASRGVTVLSFNFRGVQRSGGTYGGGRTEIRDVAAAVTRVRAEAAGPTLVCGWSFGAAAALCEATEDAAVAALALLGMPLDAEIQVPDLPTTSELRALRRPVLLVSGQGDQFSPRPALESLARKLPQAKVEIVAGTDHFFWRREAEVASLVGAFADRVLR
jgi:hypothetical protein